MSNKQNGVYSIRESPKNFEDILEQIGGFGKFQVLILIAIQFYEISAAFIAFIPIFAGAIPKVWTCDNDTISYKEVCNCSGTNVQRNAFANVDMDHISIVSEWDLVCERSYIPDLITTVQMSGMLFGNLIPPQIADWYGRKPAFISLIVIMCLGQGLSAFAQNVYIYIIARFMGGIGIAGYFSLNGIYSMEFLTPEYRQLAGCVGPLGEGIMILAVLAYYIKPWRTLMIATTLPFLTFLFILPFLPESPRWLLKQGKVSEAEKVLNTIAQTNGKGPIDTDDLKRISKQEFSSSSNSGGENDRLSYIDLFRIKDLRFKTIVFIGIWFCWSSTYFGLGYNVKNLKMDPYLITFLMGCVDAIGFRAALLINNRLGRRKALVLFISCSAAFFVLIAVAQHFLNVKNYLVLFITLMLIGKLCVAGARSAIRVLTVESYPTHIRTMGFGVSRISATVGGAISPQLAYLGSKYPSLPMVAFALLSVAGSWLSFLLKETGGKPLVENVENLTDPKEDDKEFKKVPKSTTEDRYRIKSGRNQNGHAIEQQVDDEEIVEYDNGNANYIEEPHENYKPSKNPTKHKHSHQNIENIEPIELNGVGTHDHGQGHSVQHWARVRALSV